MNIESNEHPIIQNPSPFESSMVRWILIAFFLTLVTATLTYGVLQDLSNYIYFVGMLVIVVTLKKMRKIKMRVLVGRKPYSYRWLSTLFISLVLLCYANAAIILVIYPLILLDSEVIAEFFMQSLDKTPIHAFVMTVLLAPVLEELVFRGLVFTRLCMKWGMTLGIILSSLFFGLLHFEFFVGALVIGVVLCVIYVRTKTLLVPMSIHGVYNFLVWLILISNSDQNLYLSKEMMEGYLYQGLVALIISSPVIFFMLGSWWPRGDIRAPYESNVLYMLSDSPSH